MVYREEESLLPNLYDSKLGTEFLQLLRFNILSRLTELASDAAFEALAVPEIIDQLYLVGIPSGIVEACLKTLLDSRAIRTSDGLSFSPQSKIIPNRLAGYLVRELGCSFNYFEMCLIDSYIFEKDFWTKISELTGQIENASDDITRIKLRIERVRQYVQYLLHIEERWVVECNPRGLGTSWGHQRIATGIQKHLEVDMARALASAEHMGKRKTPGTTQQARQ